MPEFHFLPGAVYILENTEVKRVKVGRTWGISGVEGRLLEVNDKWLERKVTCQFCGTRLVNVAGKVPAHQISGNRCSGGGALPMEMSVEVAVRYQKELQSQISQLAGAELASAVRRIKTLSRRIDKYRDHKPQLGIWEFRIAFYTDGSEVVEKHSHKLLEAYADKSAPIGEVFSCSVADATAAVEVALMEAGLWDAASKSTELRRISRTVQRMN